jgi:hypothetical protein
MIFCNTISHIPSGTARRFGWPAGTLASTGCFDDQCADFIRQQYGTPRNRERSFSRRCVYYRIAKHVPSLWRLHERFAHYPVAADPKEAKEVG